MPCWWWWSGDFLDCPCPLERKVEDGFVLGMLSDTGCGNEKSNYLSSDQCRSKMLALSYVYIPKLKASTENYDVTWCDIITQRQHGSIMRMLTVQNHRHATELLLRCRRLTVSRRSHTSAGRSTSTLIHHPFTEDEGEDDNDNERRRNSDDSFWLYNIINYICQGIHLFAFRLTKG